MSDLWGLYLRLARRRQNGMSINPMTYLELDAFARRCLVDLSAWEVEVLMRVDDAVVAAVHEKAPTVTASGEPAAPTEVTSEDGAGGKALFRSLAARKSKTPSQSE